ncbi:MAG TPA: transporter substrate-binding domain-containing protein [Vicinamibacteria bacterium]|nr:transporter substrate-binding domain-containing protein [Vicinamibacteria bacterium]
MLNRRRTSAARTWLMALSIVSLTWAAGGCGGTKATPAGDQKTTPAAASSPATVGDEAEALPAYEAALPEAVRATLLQRFTGDLEEMVERRVIRVGVTFNRTFYFVDKGVQRGVSYELAQAFEEQLNKKLKTTNATRIHVFFVPMPRDLLGAALTEGKVDLVAAQVTVRPELQALVDFTEPTRSNVNEVVVTGPGAPAMKSVDDLSGKDVYARKDGSAWASLVALNEQLKAKGLPPVVLDEAPPNLEDDDLLEMANAGLIPMVVVDDYLADFWDKVFPDLTVHHDLALRKGANLAVAIRKNSPHLKAELNAFLARFGLGTAFGNMLEKRYLVSTSYAKRATSEAERKKFLTLVDIFRKYGDKYGVDYLLMAAQGYQESQLNQDAKSQVGAIGVMQVMPATGKELKVGDITQLDPNIHAGVKYMRFMIDQYYKDEPMTPLDKGLFTFASYNAGPGRVRQLRREAEKRGLDPNVWFGNVEQIASQRIGRETVTYVSNIYKYYVAYRLVMEDRARREAAKASVRTGSR